MAWGNFGARPKPPKRGSSWVSVAATARSSIVIVGCVAPASPAPSPAPSSTIRPIAWCSFPACSRSSSRWPRQASSTASISRPNPVMPWRSSFGKYVPPKKGRPSGARNTVIGQPPRPVIAWTACM